jgi:hypothetical protein
MLIVGLVSTKEEQCEIRSIAQVWIVRERVRFLASQQKNKKNTKEISVLKR